MILITNTRRTPKHGSIHGASAGSVRQVLDGLKPGRSYRYGDTSVSPGSTKSGGFSCPKCHAVNIVLLAHSWWGSRVSGFEALNRRCRPQNECQHRRRVLELFEGDRGRARHEPCGDDRCDRWRSRCQSIISHSTFCAWGLSRSTRQLGPPLSDVES